ncbi:MAG: hypothetical protein IT186_26230 [Acidobacteria bacterium]|nr:hypothetical protein [Acidobacteriota bacterium]MCG3195030.1 hypothetical protein [Thermoanaerobaculia bacterium]MCK6681463.1 hypothetical protein [Thermoanaerobaculia bacterium]
MKRVVKWLGACLALSAVLLLSPWPDPATARPQAGPITTALNVIRTFAHHELTNLNNARIGGYVPAVLSKNGGVALFQVASGLTPATSIHIWSVGADGSGQRETRRQPPDGARGDEPRLPGPGPRRLGTLAHPGVGHQRVEDGSHTESKGVHQSSSRC